MSLFLKMDCKIEVGIVSMNYVSSFTIEENIDKLSNTAKIVIPRKALIDSKYVYQYLNIGDKVTIDAGYNDDLSRQFTGYVRQIEQETPVVIHCDDETYLLRRNNIIDSFKNATLEDILTRILKDIPMKFECPDVRVGKYQIYNVSSFIVLQDLKQHYGLFSRIEDSILKVGLAYDYGNNTKNHIYKISPDAANWNGEAFVKSTNLQYQRKEDFKIRYKAIAYNPKGKKNTIVYVGSKDKDAAIRTLNFAGPMTEDELRNRAIAIMSKLVYDGYTGSITGFGEPPTHAGDSLTIRDSENPERQGTYLIERVTVDFGENGFQRENHLSYKID